MVGKSEKIEWEPIWERSMSKNIKNHEKYNVCHKLSEFEKRSFY